MVNNITTYRIHLYDPTTRRDEIIAKPAFNPIDLVNALEDEGFLIYSVSNGQKMIFESAMQPSDVSDMLDLYV